MSTTRVCVYTNADASAHTVIKDFTPSEVQGVMELDDGELLVSLGNSSGVPGSLWRSTGYPTLGSGCSWAKVLDAAHDQASFSFVWGVHRHGNVVVACEYGGKTPPLCASKAYASVNSGVTFTEIYDAGQATSNMHLHGIAYDHWWDRVWIIKGDDPNQDVLYSDDWRSGSPTWTSAYTGSLLLGVLPMPGAICFTTDDEPAGIYTIKRTGYRTGEAMTLRHTVAETFINLGMQSYRRGDGYPGLFSFKVTDGQQSAGVLVASYDGIDFHEIWRDDLDPYSGGLYRAVGPTDGGKIIGTSSDSRYTPYTRLMIDAPTWSA